MPQTLKPNNKKWKKSSFYEEKSLVGLTPRSPSSAFEVKVFIFDVILLLLLL
jgi:hypothetical protein